MRWVVGGVLALLLVAGCDDSGASRLAQAKSDYALLVAQRRRPTDPAFDGVIAELKKVPEDSRAYPHAQKLLGAILAGRVRPPPVPLTEIRRRPEPPDVMKLRSKCQELASSIGNAPRSAVEKLEKRLDECKRQLDALREAHEPPN